jgi:hypothetical protein
MPIGRNEREERKRTKSNDTCGTSICVKACVMPVTDYLEGEGEDEFQRI